MYKLTLGILIVFLMSCTGNSSSSSIGWDFSKERKIIYSFQQIVNGETKMVKNLPAEKTYMNGEGFINIDVKENNLADLSLTDLNIKMVTYKSDGSASDTITQNPPPMVVQDMKADGSMSGDNDILFDILFPIPKKKMKKGEVFEIPMKMPFSTNGSRLYVKGQNTLTFKGYQEFEGRNCGVFDGEIDVSQLDIPEELSGEYKCTTKGKSRYYFDYENSYYIGADIEMTMDMMMISDSESNNPIAMNIEMKSDNIYKIRLKEIVNP